MKDWLDFYASLHPAKVPEDLYDLSQLKAAFEAGQHSRGEATRSSIIDECIRVLADKWLGQGFPGGGISDLDEIDPHTRQQCIKALRLLQERATSPRNIEEPK